MLRINEGIFISSILLENCFSNHIQTRHNQLPLHKQHNLPRSSTELELTARFKSGVQRLRATQLYQPADRKYSYCQPHNHQLLGALASN